MTKETILIGSDPSGFTLKEAVKAHLVERGFEVADVGTQSLEEQGHLRGHISAGHCHLRHRYGGQPDGQPVPGGALRFV